MQLLGQRDEFVLVGDRSIGEQRADAISIGAQTHIEHRREGLGVVGPPSTHAASDLTTSVRAKHRRGVRR